MNDYEEGRILATVITKRKWLWFLKKHRIKKYVGWYHRIGNVVTLNIKFPDPDSFHISTLPYKDFDRMEDLEQFDFTSDHDGRTHTAWSTRDKVYVAYSDHWPKFEWLNDFEASTCTPCVTPITGFYRKRKT